MKRLHVHVGVDDLDASIRFYSALFAVEPTVTKADYAKWMLDDPRVNISISAAQHASKGILHLGIQVYSVAVLAEVYGRLKAADRPVLEEGATTCCYARSEKSWIADPQGVVWETFRTTGEAVDYGQGPALDRLAGEGAAADACCAPARAQLSWPAPGCCG